MVGIIGHSLFHDLIFFSSNIFVARVDEALRVKEKCPNALSMLGSLELKNDEWVKAKETFRVANEAMGGNDSYASSCLGNWNYFAALRNEKRSSKLEATHLEKAKELYKNVPKLASGTTYARIPDVWINMGHVYFAQGYFMSVVKMVGMSSFSSSIFAICLCF
ncbi:hypothetical protein Dimus_010998 [Dionaea muscipula]